MKKRERADDFETRRKHLSGMSDEALHKHFWQLVERIVEPLVEEARTHTTPSIERSILLRMGFSSLDAKTLVEQIHERGLLGHGAGRLVLELGIGFARPTVLEASTCMKKWCSLRKYSCCALSAH